jgi:acetyl esterase
MTIPLDPVIAEIIPLLPLRDPATMTPQSARDALRALAAARAAFRRHRSRAWTTAT